MSERRNGFVRGGVWRRAAGALLLAACAAACGCTMEAAHPEYRRGRDEAADDIAHNRFQLLRAEPGPYLYRDDATGLPVRPVRSLGSVEDRAYLQGYNQRMSQWVADHGRPAYNFAPGAPSETDQFRIESEMSDPQRWVRLADDGGVLDARNGWLLHYLRRDDGLYVIWMARGPIEREQLLTTPMVLPLMDGRVVLVQLREGPGSVGRPVLYDPQAPDSPFLLQ